MKSSIINSPIAGCMRWGTWGANFTTAQYQQMIESCIEYGIHSFDHADIYGDYTTEAEFGEALKEAPSLRQHIKLITKCGIQMLTPNRPEHTIKSYNTSKEHIIRSAERSLENLGTDYLDVLLIHRPDTLLNPGEVAEAVEELKQQGKIVSFGVSNFLPHQTNLLNTYTEIDYNQVEISIIHLNAFEDGTLENCMQHKIIPMAWAPMGGGLFTDDDHPHFRAITATANELAKKYHTGLNEILLAWLHTHPSGIQTVIGTTRIERLVLAKAAAAIRLERADWYRLLQASKGEEVA
ncbi:MAG: aldo/keto reductase [Chitinophagaceae bacterium]|nr:aldo/keto reductase [Chitinophagaceae bacterium]MDP1764450.1 aldo/keto reductase [Sediminibacterium sp.]MDP1812597.1 aldo/keto reductase [Sediminibacterium sp.]MDP3127484.1 aldo/keto reductase [Sediminibacterium sp.]MDP3665052.1 aldo/keto reductase [Sediminibacterium sp.]